MSEEIIEKEIKEIKEKLEHFDTHFRKEVYKMHRKEHGLCKHIAEYLSTGVHDILDLVKDWDNENLIKCKCGYSMIVGPVK